jgi:hypothetical protein
LQKLLTVLYEGLDKEERRLFSSDDKEERKLSSSDEGVDRRVFAELYRSFAPGKSRVRLVGPVGERPVHVLLLRAGALDKEMRAGIIEGVK